MTLSTDVYILDEIDPGEVFQFCQGLLAKYDDRPGTHEQEWDDRATWRDDGSRLLGNKIGQGLPAILDVTYRPSAPLATQEQSEAHTEDCDDDGDSCRYNHPTACWLNVDFDTAYGYRDKRGWGCGDLHAALVAELGAWLDGRGVDWAWRNEFTGEVHSGPDRAEKLIELVSGGAEAGTWFRTMVVPAILAEAASNGGGKVEIAGTVVDVPDMSGSPS